VRTAIAPQRGAALIVSLIMLLLITILAVTSFRLGKSNLQIMGNIRQRDQGIHSAQLAIDQTISGMQFANNPSSPVPNPCMGTNTVCIDPSTGSTTTSGTGEIDVTVTPACDSIQPIPVTALNFSDPNDVGCLVGAGQNFGVAGANSNDSMCSNSVWNIHGAAQDSVTGATATVDEGAGVRVPSWTTCP
jgi:Tfp pilus assembly protein PilX